MANRTEDFTAQLSAALSQSSSMMTMTFPADEPTYPPLPPLQGRQVPKPLQVRQIHPDAKLPTRAKPSDAGLDLYSPTEGRIYPGVMREIKLGISVQIPQGYVGLIMGRSGAVFGGRFHVVQTGVIDAGYTGEIAVMLQGIKRTTVEVGERVAQLVILPLSPFNPVQVESLDDSARRDAGFGSTGR